MRNVAIVFVCVVANAIAYLAYRGGVTAAPIPDEHRAQLPVAVPEVAPRPTARTPAAVVPPPAQAPPAEVVPVEPVGPVAQPVRAATARKTVKRSAAQSAAKSESKSTSDDSLLKMEANPYKRGE